jgi:hypothetical protein
MAHGVIRRLGAKETASVRSFEVRIEGLDSIFS